MDIYLTNNAFFDAKTSYTTNLGNQTTDITYTGQPTNQSAAEVSSQST